MDIIDLRSDTVTKPSKKMRKVMFNASVGDDVYGEDPTVNKLEHIAAEMLETEAAVFVPSGTQSNLLALLTHCQRGDEYIAGQQAHIYKYEGGGAAVFGGIQPQPLEFSEDSILDLNLVEKFIKPDDHHFAKTRLLCLENTQSGKVLPQEYIQQAAEFTRNHKLKFHLDGARLFNATVKLNLPASEISRHFDSISICLSKGLGAPVGSLLCASHEQIAEAKRYRKMLGGGMRQAGILAAAGIYALENNISKLNVDHENARLLAEGLSGIDELTVNLDDVQTNMVFVTINKSVATELQHYLKDNGILISTAETARLVTHLDINQKDIARVISTFKNFFASRHNVCLTDELSIVT